MRRPALPLGARSITALASSQSTKEHNGLEPWATW